MTVLKLYNTKTREKHAFKPINEGAVGMYVCGPTVYDYAHIGNARPVIIFDVLFRLLRQIYGTGKVNYVRNITDVDDKIIAAQQDSGEDINVITSRTIRAFQSDMKVLGNLEPSIEPQATDHIPQMIKMIEKLILKGNAYQEQGHVCFHVPSMANYGRLSRLNREELIVGARVEVAPYKRDPADFILWKPSSSDQPGWDSPWGRGRPGWHIECSAMSNEYLGITFDIHGGGQDLIFPHHENEIAQSCCANGEDTFAQIWMHNGYLMVDGEKMSKSLGNFITVRDLLDSYHGETIRLCMLMTHYRQPLNWTSNGLAQAKSSLDSFYGALRQVNDLPQFIDELSEEFMTALLDDINTPEAIKVLHELSKDLNKAETKKAKAQLKGKLLAAGKLLGILNCDPDNWFESENSNLKSGLSEDQINKLILARNNARDDKNFALSDKIRDELLQSGIVLEDSKSITRWKRL